MAVVGEIESLWRYPVKSMRGETLEEAFIGFAGVYGDRLYAFTSSAGPKGFPYLTGREHQELLLYRPRFRHPEKAALPPNLAEAAGMAPGVNPMHAAPEELAVEVETPTGCVHGIDAPALIDELEGKLGEKHRLTLRRSEQAMTDCRPISMFAVQTVHRLGEELGFELDARRFRANIYMDLASSAGFAEDSFVGRTLRIGPQAEVWILERDPRCAMITFDPDTGERTPAVLAKVTQAHGGMAGVYGAVRVEGTVKPGDAIEVLC